MNIPDLLLKILSAVTSLSQDNGDGPISKAEKSVLGSDTKDAISGIIKSYFPTLQNSEDPKIPSLFEISLFPPLEEDEEGVQAPVRNKGLRGVFKNIKDKVDEQKKEDEKKSRSFFSSLLEKLGLRGKDNENLAEVPGHHEEGDDVYEFDEYSQGPPVSFNHRQVT